eukprot:2164212-Amphidinium_carterae.1
MGSVTMTDWRRAARCVVFDWVIQITKLCSDPAKSSGSRICCLLKAAISAGLRRAWNAKSTASAERLQFCSHATTEIAKATRTGIGGRIRSGSNLPHCLCASHARDKCPAVGGQKYCTAAKVHVP